MKQEQRQIWFPLSFSAPPLPRLSEQWNRQYLGQSGVRGYDVMSHSGHEFKSQVRTKWAKTKEEGDDGVCLPDILFPEQWLFLHFLFGTFGHLGGMRRRLPLTHWGLCSSVSGSQTIFAAPPSGEICFHPHLRQSQTRNLNRRHYISFFLLHLLVKSSATNGVWSVSIFKWPF